MQQSPVRIETGSKIESDSDIRLALILGATATGTWGFDGRVKFWDDMTKSLFGIRREIEPTGELFLSLVHSLDCDRYKSAFSGALDPAGPGIYDCQYRIHRQDDGAERWLHSRGRSFFENGKFVRIIGIVEDITARRQVENDASQLARHISLSHEAMFAWNLTSGITFWNEGSERLYGFTREEALGRISHNLLQSRFPDRTERIVADLIAARSWSGETVHTAKNGRKIIVESRLQIGSDGVTVLEVNRDITERKAAENALRESEERFRTITDKIPLVVWMHDETGAQEFVNETFCEFFGVNRDEMLQGRWRDLVHPEDAAAYTDTFLSAVRHQKDFHGEVRARRADGQWRWLESWGRPRFDSTGRYLGHVGISADITDRKHRDQRVELLLRELNHRVKNMLSVVQAIARSSVATNSKDFMTRFSERIQTLGAAHDLLVRGEWRGADLAELVAAHLTHFDDGRNRHIRIHGKPVFVSAAAAQNLSIALHELATNAVKHGALVGGKGSVDLTWEIRGATFEMSWVERGGHPVSPPAHHGFGRLVLEKIVKMALDADIEAHFDTVGYSWRMRCPASLAITEETDERSSDLAVNLMALQH